MDLLWRGHGEPEEEEEEEENGMGWGGHRNGGTKMGKERGISGRGLVHLGDLSRLFGGVLELGNFLGRDLGK